MGKIVKYCNSCDEGFAERFTFCPVCGGSLAAHEMNPVTENSQPVHEEPMQTQPAFVAEAPVENASIPVNNEVYATAEETPVAAEEPVDLEYDDSKYDQITVEDTEPAPAYTLPVAADDDGDYHITVIQEENGQRNGLLLAATIFMIMFVGGAVVYSLFIKPLDVGAIGDETSLAYLLDVAPVDIEEKEQKPDKDKSGGGGGGGRQEKDPPSQGDLADQTKNPIRPPDVHIPKLDNPALVLPPASTQGDQKFEKKYNKYGLPNGLDGLSNGTGTGRGLGNGYGTGQGNGSGTGAGNGTGSGYGNGNGNGNGNGTGDGDRGGPPPSSI